jgi:phosphotransferase system  glucose/maltose/N-acetylglucosamine-specific IIC component
MDIFLAIYLGVAACWLFVSVVMFLCCETADDKAKFARGIFFAPIWPLVVMYCLGMLARYMWDLADWKSM